MLLITLIRPILPIQAATRNRAGNGIVCAAKNLRSRSPRVRLMCLRASTRNGLIKSRYGTPLGHAGSHARHPKQRSTCGCAASKDIFPSSTTFMRTMRPRGVSISCPSS